MKTKLEFSDSVFAWRYAQDASVNQIADAAIATWRDINIALSSIIGQQGIAAVIKRSVHLQRLQFPALNAIQDSDMVAGEFSALHAVLLQQTITNAVLINNALVNTFYEQLEYLIGSSLIHQLLHSSFAPPAGGNPLTDTHHD